MDPSPKSHPILSYVMSRIPSMGPRYSLPVTVTNSSPLPLPSDLVEISIDQPSSSSHHASRPPPQIVDQMPHLAHPKLFASMANAVTNVAHTRAILKTIGQRPDHEAVDEARTKLAEIEFALSKKLEEIVLSPRPSSVDRLEWRAHLAEKERQCREEAEKDKTYFKGILALEEIHDAYAKMLKEAEEKLVNMYETATTHDTDPVIPEEVNEDVVDVLNQGLASGELQRVDLSGRRLRILPEPFGKIHSLVVLNLSKNQLEALPDSIAGLGNLEELNLSSNLLASLPDSIGLLHKLKYLNASGNKLTSLPDSISGCRSLVELDVSFNGLTYLPTNIGHDMPYLEKLCIQLNKIRSLPTSVCGMKSLRHLDAHFNELRGLPLAIGYLTNLETLDLSSNFSDLTELPETFGDLINLKELDLSNNQLYALPDTFGRLEKLVKLNLEENPLAIPPPQVVKEGVEAVKVFMVKRWVELLVEEEKRSMQEAQDPAQAGWLTRSTSWLKGSVSGLMSPRAPADPYLDQQL